MKISKKSAKISKKQQLNFGFLMDVIKNGNNNINYSNNNNTNNSHNKTFN